MAVLGELSSLLHLRGASTPTVDSVVIFVIIIFIFFLATSPLTLQYSASGVLLLFLLRNIIILKNLFM